MLTPLPDVILYPTTQLVNGEISYSELVVDTAFWLYDKLVCDYRLRIEDVDPLLRWAQENRGKK